MANRDSYKMNSTANLHIVASSEQYTHLVQDYQLPNAVKLKLDADTSQASSIAIVVTLLAGALINLTAIIGGYSGIDSSNEGSDSWKAFRVILWSAIIFDVGEAFVCILAIKMCSDLPLLAMAQQTLQLEDSSNPDNRFGAAISRDHLGPKLLRDPYLLLESVGMPRAYRYVDRLVIWLLVVSSAFSFVTLIFWVLQTQTHLTAGVTMIPFAVVVVIVITVFAIAMGAGRRRF